MTQLLDPEIPGFATALNTDSVLDMMHRAILRRGFALDLIKLKIWNVQYTPRERCRILYKLKFRNPQTGRSARQLLSAQLLRKNEIEPSAPPELLTRYDSLNKKSKLIPTPMLYLPETHMLIQAFPADTSLPWLFDVIDPSKMKQSLRRSREGSIDRVQKVKVRFLGYTPQSRATFLYELLGEFKDGPLPGSRRLIGKIHAHRPAAKRFANSWALNKALHGQLYLAAPVEYIAPLNLSLQEEVKGKRLSENIRSSDFLDMMRQTARAIAKVHGLSLPVSTIRTFQNEIGVIDRWSNLLMAISPKEAKRLNLLRNQLAAEVEAYTQVGVPIHGDFHHTNILFDGNRIILIDFDELSYGDPSVDVGRFVASLRVPAMRIFSSPSGLVEAQETFLAEYLTKTQENERKVRIYEAVSLLISAATPFRLQRQGWETQTSILIDEAEQVLNRARSTAVSFPKTFVKKESLPFEGRRNWARDEIYMLAVIDPHIRNTYGAEPITCRLTSEMKTHHSSYFLYQLAGVRINERWELSVKGIMKKGRSGRALFQRIQSLHVAVDGKPYSLNLPRPIAYFSPLKMLVLEEPTGIRFSSLVGTPDALDQVTRLGKGLALFHSTHVEMDKTSTLRYEISALRNRIERLKEIDGDLHDRAQQILSEIDRRISGMRSETAPVLHTLDAHHIIVDDGQLTIADVEEIALSHPLIDVGNFLASLTHLGVIGGIMDEVEEVRRVFYSAYIEAGGINRDDTALFEARALIRLACMEAEKKFAQKNAWFLIECAAARLI